MPFRVKVSEKKEVGDNALYFPDAARAPRLESIANSEKQLRIMSLKRKKNIFFAECYNFQPHINETSYVNITTLNRKRD